jgi:MarR family 2-MHQ and catechol resistance regulon transcriptional repressor
MHSDVLEKVAVDLLSIPPLIFRGVRRKLLKTTLVDTGADISPLHFEIMKLLHEAGTLHIAEIGERLRIARAQMTHLVDKLVDLGIVERQMDTTDRRMTNIVLTGKGGAFLKERDSDIRNAVKETLSCLTDEELKDLSDSLRKLRDILSKLQ